MSAILFGDFDEVPLDQAKVRATTAPVEQDAPPAEEKGAPEFNEVERDGNPDLGGLAHRALAPDWHDSEKYAPWLNGATATADYTKRVDDQIATSGTAAQRELAGQQGHGTFAYAVGIEPVIRDGAAFGNEYFAVDKPEVEDIAGLDRGVQPALGTDRDSIAAVAAYGNAAKTEATDSVAALYRSFIGG